ncbi:MAG TPA: trypsin-like peptidase domain-containing protein [Opitutaceae bacterium]|nr:trypsin-like peptidase domain-containing protein [Opitutaceae bacterium]
MAWAACLADARVWTIDGKTKVEAEFGGMIGDVVFLRQTNGNQLKFNLASLSAADQAYIKNRARGDTSVVPSSPSDSSESQHAYVSFDEAQPIDMAPGGSRPVSFRRAVFNIQPGTTIGKIYWVQWQRTETVKAPPAIVGSEQYATIARDELQKAHYSLLGGESLIFGDDASAKARYQLGAEVSDIRINIEAIPSDEQHGFFNIDGSITIHWQVYDTLEHKIIYTHTTCTGYKANEDDVSAAFNMFRKGTRQLLASPDFVAFMKPVAGDQDDAANGSSFGTAFELPSFHREKALVLPADFPTLVDGVVMIKPGAGFGTGFVITENGYALTAAHVVSGLKTVSVRLHNGLVLDAEVVRVDEGADVALIKLPGTSHKPVELAPDKPAVGMDVYAIGNPALEELSSSVTKGVVSGNREIDGHKLIQTDVSANPGNSGGPLISKDGRVIGIVCSKIAGPGFEGLAFAVPISEAIAKLNLKFASATSN